MTRITHPLDQVDQAEARLPRWMAAFAVAGVAVSLAALRTRFAMGLALGSVLSILTYYWLHQTVSTLFDSGLGRLPKTVVLKYVLRYPLALAAIYLAYRTRWLPFEAIVAGLFAPVAGVMAESVVQIVRALREPSD